MAAASPAHAVVDPTLWQAQTPLTDTADGQAYDFFGWSVATDGNTAIVGAESDDFSHFRSGAAYVFVRTNTTWARQQMLVASDAAPHDLFGASVAIDGDTAIIGALRNDVLGQAYIFVRTEAVWSEQQILMADIPLQGDLCGFSVAISGDTAVMGCQNNGIGTAYVFVRSGTTWSQQAKLRAPGGVSGDQWARSVALSGDTLIVGAGADKLGGAAPLGSATIFFRTGTTWAQQQKLTAADGVAFDGFGLAVALSGDTALIGQVSGDFQNSPHRQSACVFVRSGTVWAQQAKLVADDTKISDSFGASVALRGDTAIVGAFGDDLGATNGTNEGSAYRFQRSGTAWTQKQKLTASDGAQSDGFGFSVAVSDTAAIVGAPSHMIGSNIAEGEAYPFLNADSDGDGLPDDWEKNGVTIDGQFIDLKAMGANPMHKDVFVHADWMQNDPAHPAVAFKPNARALKIVSDAFARAPIDNPDHKRGIRLHVDLGSTSIMNPVTGAKWGALSRAGEIPYQSVLGTAVGDDFQWAQVDTLKNTHFTPAKRRAVFHYALFANDFAGADRSSGIARALPGADFLVTLGSAPVRGGTILQQAGTFMHELGHNLGLHHGGADDVNKKPNYLSIMNYSFQFIGLLQTAQKRAYDYSRSQLPTLDETALNEVVGIADPSHFLTLWFLLSRPTVPAGANKCITTPSSFNRLFLPSASLDWDCDGAKSVPLVAADINGDGLCILPGPNGVSDSGLLGDDDRRLQAIGSGPNRMCESIASGDDIQKRAVGYVQPNPLTGYKDWPNLLFDGGGKIGDSTGAVVPDEDTTVSDEPTMEELLDAVPSALLDEEPVAPLDDVTVSTSEGPAPLVVQFDASTSTAVTGGIADWAWDFGDGTTGAGAMVQHTYDTPGEYFASVSVTDDSNRTNLVSLYYLITVTEGGVATPTPVATPSGLGPFVAYSVQGSKAAGKFLKFGPVALAGGLGSGAYDVTKETLLAAPANVNAAGFVDVATHLTAYAVKPAKGSAKFTPHADVSVANACGGAVVTASKPTSLLVPTAVDPSVAPSPPTDRTVDHFLCYQVKAQKKRADGTVVTPFPKGVQVDVVDQFQTRRYDLKKVVQLCVPVAKSGTPKLLAGPQKGSDFAITPAAIGNAGTQLLCYQSALAKKTIAQNGCGPANPLDKGTALPPQAKHAPRLGLFIANQFGARRFDTKKDTLVCIPSTL